METNFKGALVVGFFYVGIYVKKYVNYTMWKARTIISAILNRWY